MHRQRRAGGLVCAAALAFAVVVTACAPALNWRDVPCGPGSLWALFPCRPDEQVRAVQIEGRPVTMTLRSCEAAGLLFALSSIDVGSADAVNPVLAALGASARANLGDAHETDLPQATAEGLAPSAVRRRVQLEGRGADGKTRYAQIGQFAQGTQVYQATILGSASWADNSTQAFFGGIHFQ
jgi:hypothetical protein